MNIVAIVQARMGSSRLPGKIIMPLGDRPVYKWVYNRLQESNCITSIIFATTESDKDNIFCQQLRDEEINFMRGSEQDVLSRYYTAALESSADVIVRVTCDCPFIDPALIDRGIKLHFNESSNYTSNVAPPTFPDGFDFEIFSKECLVKAYRNAKSQYEREHVTPWIIEHTEGVQSNVTFDDDCLLHVHKRVTLDNEDDLKLLRTLVEEYNVNIASDAKEIINVLDEFPLLQNLNQKHDVRIGVQ